MSAVLAIDPGNTESGWALIDTETCRPLAFDKTPNPVLRAAMLDGIPGDDVFGFFDQVERVYIEMVASYGMSVGATVFETCVWIGRFDETRPPASAPAELVYRRDVKLHHCGQTKANDSNIKQALVDRFAPGVRNHGKGTKAEPGWFYGFRADVWQAYALAVLAADRIENRPGVAA